MQPQPAAWSAGCLFVSALSTVHGRLTIEQLRSLLTLKSKRSDSMMDDLVERARKGDSAARATLVTENYAEVTRFCCRRLGDDLGRDAAQETFLRLSRALQGYNGSSTFKTWLLGIALNQCRNLSRKHYREVLSMDHWHSEPSSNNEGQLLDRQSLTQALQALSQEHREVVLLHEVDGLKYSEIAEVLGVPVGTVKSRLHHAFRQLRTLLEVYP